MTTKRHAFSIDNVEYLGGDAPFFATDDPRFMTIPLWNTPGGSVVQRLRDPGVGLQLLAPGTVPFEDLGTWYNAVVEQHGGWVHEGQTCRFPRMDVLVPNDANAAWLGAHFGVEAKRGTLPLGGVSQDGFLIRLPYLWPGGEGANGFLRLVSQLQPDVRQRIWIRRPQDEAWTSLAEG